MAILKIPIQSTSYKAIIKQGDVIEKIPISFSEGVDFTDATIKIQLYFNRKLITEWTDGSGITIIDALNCEIDEVVNNDFPVGTLKGDFQVTRDGKNKTYFDIEIIINEQFTT